MAGLPLPDAAPSPPLRWLIVNGDDFGLTAGVNAGIELACREGILRSASVMAMGHALRDAGQRSSALPSLGLGIHLTLVGERPVCPPAEVPSLVDRGGCFLPTYRRFLLRYLSGGIRPGDLRREFRAQAEVVSRLGVPLDHVDSHQHLHLLPGLLSLSIEIARELDIRWVRAPRADLPSSAKMSSASAADADAPRPMAERWMFALASAWARRQVARMGLPLTRGSLGFDCAGHLSTAYLLRHVNRLPPGVTELICHPGSGDPETRSRYGAWGYCWDQEREALTSPEVRQALERAGVRVARFAELPVES
jgi:hopanoid biosynthesis associated protein HpnK